MSAKLVESLTPERIAELRELYKRTTQGNYIARWDELAQAEHDATMRDIGAKPLGKCIQVCVSDDVSNVFVADFGVDNSALPAERNAEWYAAAHNAMPALLETLAEKDKRIAEAAEVEAAQFAVIDELRAELQQRDKRIAELERILKLWEDPPEDPALSFREAEESKP